MDAKTLQVPPRLRKRSLLGSSASALGTAPNASVSTRLNTHVLLGLSVLMLSANAQPLDATSSSSVASSLGVGRLGGLNLLGIAEKGLSKVGESALGERIIESIGKALGPKPLEMDTQRLLDEEPTSLGNVIPLEQEVALQDDRNTPNGEFEVDSQQHLPTSDEAIPNPAHFLEDLVTNNPALSFALNIADLMHKMRELFVDIAVLEGEERGLRFGDRPAQDTRSQESSDLRLEEPTGVLGLQLHPDVESDQVVITADVDELQFDLDISPDVSVTLPGSFDVDSADETKADAFVPPGLNPLVNPYAALAMSSVLATMFVVSLMVGRHYFLAQAAKQAEPDLEQGPPSDSTGDDEVVEKATSPPIVEELDEKALIELNAPPESILTPSSDSKLAQGDAKEAQEALELLIDVANAALSASILPVDGSNGTPTKVDTPKIVAAALETMRAEMNKTPLNFDVEKGSLSRRFLLARSRPATPFRAPSRPQTPSLTIIPAEDTTFPTLSKPVPRSSTLNDSILLDSAASSYVSATSNLGNMLERPVPFHPTVYLNSPTPSMVHLSSPAPTYVTAHPSPAMSYATAQASPAACEVSLRETAPIRERIDSPVLSTGTFDSPRPSRGNLVLFGEEMQLEDNRVESRAYTGSVIPPAHLTETALNLALMLPATEWIFQFLVVFIGWFGFWMRPVQTSHRRGY